MPDFKPALYVLCSTEDSRRAWLSRAPFHFDLDVIPVPSATTTPHELALSHNEPFLVGLDSVWVGLGMGRQVERLLEELNERFPNWAACGNRGVRWDGEILDFSRDIAKSGLRTSLCAHPVISLDNTFLLMNPSIFRRHSSQPDLSIECLENGSVMAVSPRLMTMRTAGSCAEADRALAAHASQPEALEHFDRSLAQATRKPSLTICSRTQFRRPEMLARTVASFDACRGRTGLLSDLRIQLVTDQTPEIAEPTLRRLREAHPDAGLGCWFAQVGDERLSRIDLHRAAMERAETDYIWLIDDDDYANPETLPAMARCLSPDAPVLVIASTAIMNEVWVEDGQGGKRLAQAERGAGYPAPRVLEVLRGDNRIPTCGMVLPVKLMRERFRTVASLGEFHEDYYMLLLALTSPRIEVSILDLELTSISVRGKENTYGTDDWSVWHQSYATFLLELLNHDDGNPFLWQLGNVPGKTD